MADVRQIENQQTTQKRFPTLTDEEISKIIEGREAGNTKKSTEMAVRVFRGYLAEKNLPTDFETLSSEILDQTLKSFFLEARTVKGELYKKSSLISIRHGINRHLANSGRDVDIVKGLDFKSSQLAFKSMAVKLKESGKGGVDHFPPLESADLQRLYTYFESDCDNPETMQEKVFVDIMLYFGRRGRENLRDLKIVDFWLTTDSEGVRYIYIKRDEKTKNHQNDTNTAMGEMYELKGMVSKFII